VADCSLRCASLQVVVVGLPLLLIDKVAGADFFQYADLGRGG
jgi:hypothetical protein